MTGRNEPMALSKEQMMTVLENAPVAIAVSAMESRQLLYANVKAKEFLHFNTYENGITCYEALGYEQPCSFCQVNNMNRTELLVRKFQCPENGRFYELSGKLIDWEGQPAHIEYILDITQTQRKEEQLKTVKEELQATFSNIPCGLCVYRFSEEGLKAVFHNPAFDIVMGYSEEHIRLIENENGFLGVYPDDLELLQEKVQEAVQNGGILEHSYRFWNDEKDELRWIRVEGTVKSQPDGTKLLYNVYTDISESKQLKQKIADTGEKMQDIINAIPGGVAIYKVSDIFETVYFSDGVPRLTGYTVEEYQELIKKDAAQMTYWEDTPLVVAKANEVIRDKSLINFEFRKQHRDGYIIWVRVQIKWIGEEDGYPLLHCVFHNITDLKKAQLEMDYLINSIPGGIVSYRVEGLNFVPIYFSDGVASLAGYTREEYEGMVKGNAFNIIHETDKNRVLMAAENAIKSGGILDISYRIRHKDGNLIWIHLNGQRIGPLAEKSRFYAVLSGMSEETRLFQDIANETADGLYVIEKGSFDLLYINETKKIFANKGEGVGEKCYAALHGKSEPCEFCTLTKHEPNGKEHAMNICEADRHYSTRFRETSWNGIPAYVKYVRDVTEEVKIQQEKERLEEYFQTVIKYLPGGVAVVQYNEDGSMTPEFMSNGFAAMTGMMSEEAWDLYREDALAGLHPEHRDRVMSKMRDFVTQDGKSCEMIYRLKKGDGSYIWVKSSFTMIQSERGISRIYASYQDITKEREEKNQLHQQYNDLLHQHYRTYGPDVLVVGHCNVTKNKIIEINDYTDSKLLKSFGVNRENFFTGIASLITDPKEQQAFLDCYLNASILEAFMENKTELIQNCYIHLPDEQNGRYVQFKVNLIEAPDTGDLTGILTVTDVTEQTISDLIMHQLSVASYDLVLDINLYTDHYKILNGDLGKDAVPQEPEGSHSDAIAYMVQCQVLPKDREKTAKLLESDYVLKRLEKDKVYSFSYAITGEDGDVRVKNLTISAVDLRLGRVCMARTDITESVRGQQRFLNVIAYTFELLMFIDIDTDYMTLYTRKMVLKNLSPLVAESYSEQQSTLFASYQLDGQEDRTEWFDLESMVKCLEEKTSGYDFVLPYQSKEGLQYKQINVLWGDANHKTVCMVQADVTDMLSAEHRSQKALEDALNQAEEANQAKSNFLSSMSHDIRTPMNAIMGMTMLATANMDNREKVEDCIRKISFSSKHLLSLINDILDMSKIERSQLALNRMKIDLAVLMEQLGTMMEQQAKEAGLHFHISSEADIHPYFYGDLLRISQIMINILGNAIKFTPEGGSVEFRVQEIQPVKSGKRSRYRFLIRDTGIGISEESAARIFEPCSRSQNISRVEGTGLGLSITKGLVDLMEGEISLESQKYKGTTFQVELEFETAEDGEGNAVETKMEIPSRESLDMLSGCCFLVAEDNAINSEILCELLEMYGIKTVVKADGVQTVQAFQNAPPETYDAILMDIQMPQMNGYEAARAIRKLERPDAAKIPIIAMTANAFSEDIKKAFEAGMSAHVAKPIDMQVLCETLIRCLTRGKYV